MSVFEIRIENENLFYIIYSNIYYLKNIHLIFFWKKKFEFIFIIKNKVLKMMSLVVVLNISNEIKIFSRFLFFFDIFFFMSATNEQHRNENESSSEMIVKAINYPPGYSDKKLCNKNDEKHKNCLPMHCHHIQPMQSATNDLSIEMNPNHTKK